MCLLKMCRPPCKLSRIFCELPFKTLGRPPEEDNTRKRRNDDGSNFCNRRMPPPPTLEHLRLMPPYFYTLLSPRSPVKRKESTTQNAIRSLSRFCTMAGKGGVWVFYYLQGEDGDSVETPNAFNVRDGV